MTGTTSHSGPAPIQQTAPVTSTTLATFSDFSGEIGEFVHLQHDESFRMSPNLWPFTVIFQTSVPRQLWLPFRTRASHLGQGLAPLPDNKLSWPPVWIGPGDPRRVRLTYRPFWTL